MYPSLSPLYALFWAIDPCLPVIKLDPTHIKEHRVALFLVEPSPCHKAVEILIWTNHPMDEKAESLDWFVGENLQENPIFNGKNHGFL